MKLPSMQLVKDVRALEARAGELKGVVERMGSAGEGDVGRALSVSSDGDALMNSLYAFKVPSYLTEKRSSALNHLAVAINEAFDIPTIQGEGARAAALENFAGLERDLAGMRHSVKVRTGVTVGAGVTAAAAGAVAVGVAVNRA